MTNYAKLPQNDTSRIVVRAQRHLSRAWSRDQETQGKGKCLRALLRCALKSATHTRPHTQQYTLILSPIDQIVCISCETVTKSFQSKATCTCYHTAINNLKIG